MNENGLKSGTVEPALRIWLVDDDEFCRAHLIRSLRGEPRVDCSRSFSSALSLLAALRQEPPPEAILMDMHMPGMTGIEAIRPVRKLAPFTRVFILTTIFDLQIKKTALAAGAEDFLLKRYSREQILDALFPTPSDYCSPGRARPPFLKHDFIQR